MIKAGLAKLLTVKLGIAAGTAVAATGVAVAAATGTLPNPLHGSPAASHAPGKPSDKPGDKPDAKPSPNLHGLCQAYSAGNKDSQGKALESPAFTALITAAGGKDSVETFCADMAKSPGPGKPTNPGQNHPTGKPDVPTPSHPGTQPSKRGQ